MDEIKNGAATEGPVTQRAPPEPGNIKFLITGPDKIDDGDGDWGFTIFAEKEIFLATVTYANQADAVRGRIAMEEALKDAVFIATAES